jgi:hypothetical protein
VLPSEGIPFLYAVWFSMRATYFSVSLVDVAGNELSRDTIIMELGLDTAFSEGLVRDVIGSAATCDDDE